ncbi:MAG: hypothetical protein GAK45_02546 [Pseudomonas citronellolis]|nr:MAG: hypothetical protein GAK45_02546 [Pseudomonas citronellolis]
MIDRMAQVGRLARLTDSDGGITGLGDAGRRAWLLVADLGCRVEA